MEENILQLFPAEQRPFWKRAVRGLEDLQEIRLRVGRPVILYAAGNEYFPDSGGNPAKCREEAVCMDRQGLEAVLKHICQDSFYAFEDELKQGFLTVAGDTGWVFRDKRCWTDKAGSEPSKILLLSISE